jgi:hypothetical protein
MELKSKQTLDHNPIIRYTDIQINGFSGEKDEDYLSNTSGTSRRNHFP